MDGTRYLIVNADDYGIGPATSRGILDLAALDVLTSTVLLVNSPHAESAVRAWRQVGAPIEMGWHPCLTLDQPILPASHVPSLVDEEGTFFPLGSFLRKLWLGRLRHEEIHKELDAQYRRFREMVGQPPTVVNSHHHVQVFRPIGCILLEILGRHSPLPYLRRVKEPLRVMACISGARIKRLVLSSFGTRDARKQTAAGFQGNEWLMGVTNPPCVANPNFLTRWLAKVPGQLVELTCHPGHWDTSLLGRDCRPGDGQLLRRVQEMQLLKDPRFREAARRAGFVLISPSDWMKRPSRGAHAA